MKQETDVKPATDRTIESLLRKKYFVEKNASKIKLHENVRNV